MQEFFSLFALLELSSIPLWGKWAGYWEGTYPLDSVNPPQLCSQGIKAEMNSRSMKYSCTLVWSTLISLRITHISEIFKVEQQQQKENRVIVTKFLSVFGFWPLTDTAEHLHLHLASWMLFVKCRCWGAFCHQFIHKSLMSLILQSH